MCIYPEMTENLDDFAFIPDSIKSKAKQFLPAGISPDDSISRSWSHAFNEKQLVENKKAGGVCFQILDCTNTDMAVVAFMKPNKNDDPKHPWCVAYVGKDDHDTLGFYDIQKFAYVPWKEILSETAELALDEEWGPKGHTDYPVLRSYLSNTYGRLVCEKKVLIAEDGSFAAFNTGLVNKYFEDIYMCFEPNNRPLQKWKYSGTCIAGENELGKKIVEVLPCLPKTACYAINLSDLVYDSSKQLFPDYEHIIKENIGRYPIAFIREQLGDSKEACILADRIADADPTDERLHRPENQWDKTIRENFDRLSDLLGDNPDLYKGIQNRLSDAIELACKRARWSFRTAVPSYYPVTRKITLLLPLCLKRDTVPSLALAVSKSIAGNYQGETILTLDMAYNNARLLCRPESDWLIVNK